MNVIGPGPNAAKRTDVDDPASANFSHLFRGFLAAEKCCLQVDVVDEIPLGFRDIERIEAGEPGGIIHEAIEGSELVPNFLEQAADLAYIRQIRLENGRAAAFARDVFGLLARCVVVNRDVERLSVEFEGNDAADSFRRACDEDFPPHAAWDAVRASEMAWRVADTSSGVWTADTKAASNCDGGK